jgi:hypothetical protein
MQWEQQDVSDDHGKNRRRELCAVARDGQGFDWIVSPHDDGTYNWQRWAGDEPIDMGQGFKTIEEAQAAAERYAAEVLG